MGTLFVQAGGVTYTINTGGEPPPSGDLDIYGGYEDLAIAAEDIEAGIAGYFCTAKIGDRWVFRTPDGNAFFMRACYYAGDRGTTLGGAYYPAAITAKYGSATSWVTALQCVRRLKTWGFNALGEDCSAYALPVGRNGSQVSCAEKLPFIYGGLQICSISFTNRYNWGTAPVKDVLQTILGTVYSGGYYGKCPDMFDGNFSLIASGRMGEVSGTGWTERFTNERTTIPWIIGITPDDADYTYGLKRWSETHLGWVALVTPPKIYFGMHGSSYMFYADTTNNTKVALQAFLQERYGTIAALNAEWSSTYSDWGSTTPTRYSGEAFGTGDGATLIFDHTCAQTPVVPNSIVIKVDGVNKCGDLAQGTPRLYGTGISFGSTTINYTTGAIHLVFAGGYAPANSAAITIDYDVGGWTVGTKFLDEDGTGAWIGNDYKYLDGTGGGGTPPTETALKTDLDEFLTTFAVAYFDAMKAARDLRMPNHLLFTMAPAQRAKDAVMAAWTGRFDVLQINYQADQPVDFETYMDAVCTYWTGPIYKYAIHMSQSHSPFASTCDTTLGSAVLTNVSNTARFAANQSVYVTAGFATTGPFTITGTPTADTITLLNVLATSTEADITVYVAPGSTVFDYGTQELRGAGYATDLSAMLAYQAPDLTYPFVGMDWWAWTDKNSERANFGLVSQMSDNAYDGVENVTDNIPNNRLDAWGYPLQNEAAEPHGDFLSSVTAAHAGILAVLIASAP